MRRVVVTGLGLVTPIGTGKTAFQNLIEYKSGIIALTGKEYQALPSKVAARVQDSIQTDYSVSKLIFTQCGIYIFDKDARKLSPFMIFAMEAARQAFHDSGYLPSTDEQSERTVSYTNIVISTNKIQGVCIGSGIGCLDEILQNARAFEENVTPI